MLLRLVLLGLTPICLEGDETDLADMKILGAVFSHKSDFASDEPKTFEILLPIEEQLDKGI